MYYSAEWLRKNILKQSDDEIDDIDKQINAEPDPLPDEEGENGGPAPAPAPRPPVTPTNGTSNNNGSEVL